MFEGLKQTIAGVLRRMLNRLTLGDKTKIPFAITEPMEKAISLWTQMYRNKAPWLNEDVVSLNISAFVSSEVARMATVEMKGTVKGSERAEYLNDLLQRVVSDTRRFTEYAAATGSVALKPYIDGDTIAVDYVKADAYFPTAFDSSGNVTGCIFVDRLVRGDVAYTRLENHRMEEGGCRITSTAYKARVDDETLGVEVPLGSVEEWAELEPDALITGVDKPLFAILKMPFANTIDPESPMGVSVFARAVDMIREADMQFSRLLWEMQSGDRALYVDVRAFVPEGVSPGALPFKRFYRTMDGGANADKELFEAWTPEFRDQNQINALNEIVQRIEDVCGLSRGTISEAPESAAGGAKTATQLRIMRQRTYATVRDVQKAIRDALSCLLWAMDVWASIGGLAPKGTYNATFEFDDSIVSDRQTEFLERQQLVAMGLLQPWEMRAWYLDENEETARKMTMALDATEDDLPEE